MAARRAPAGLGSSGRALWRAYADTELGEQQVALLTEACRCRDRLDRFDEIIRGDLDTWVYLIADRGDDETELHITIDKAVERSNQTATNLRLILEKLPEPTAASKPAEGTPAPATPVDQLNQRREARKAGDGLTTRSRTAARRRKR